MERVPAVSRGRSSWISLRSGQGNCAHHCRTTEMFCIQVVKCFHLKQVELRCNPTPRAEYAGLANWLTWENRFPLHSCKWMKSAALLQLSVHEVARQTPWLCEPLQVCKVIAHQDHVWTTGWEYSWASDAGLYSSMWGTAGCMSLFSVVLLKRPPEGTSSCFPIRGTAIRSTLYHAISIRGASKRTLLHLCFWTEPPSGTPSLMKGFGCCFCNEFQFSCVATGTPWVHFQNHIQVLSVLAPWEVILFTASK